MSTNSTCLRVYLGKKLEKRGRPHTLVRTVVSFRAREAQVATWLTWDRRQAFRLCHLEGWMRVSFEKLEWVRAEIAAVVPGNVTKVACR